MTSWAEVKLRIYLKDGTLQAGNLIQEKKDIFILLTRSGRLEVPKEEIMFVNGKTLKQWQDRPDKLFQTEFIPDELPKPGYVNSKAELAKSPKPVISNKPLPPLESVLGQSADLESSQAEALSEESVNQEAASSEVKEEDDFEDTSIDEVLGKQPQHKEFVVEPLQGEKSVPIEEPVQASEKVVEKTYFPLTGPMSLQPVKVKKKPAVVVKKNTKRIKMARKPISKKKKITKAAQKKRVGPRVFKPKRYTRKGFATYHFKRALAYLEMGENGKAIHELHLSTVLNRRNAEGAFLLGKLYMETGVFPRAKKILNHPGLKKRTEVKDLLQKMEAVAETTKKDRVMFFASASVGFLVSVPLIIIAKKYRRIRKPPMVIDAQTLPLTDNSKIATEEKLDMDKVIEEISSKVDEFKNSEAFEKEMNNPVQVTPTIEGKSIQEPTAEEPIVPKLYVEEPPIEKPPVEKPSVEKPSVNKQPESIPAIPQEEVVSPPSAPVFPYVETNVPSVSEPLPPIPEPVPVPHPPPAPPPVEPLSPAEEHRLILNISTQTDAAVSKGHEFAAASEIESARREYRTAVALNPACVEAYLGLGYLCFMKGQWELALANYVKALEFKPDCADAYYGIGRVLLETKGTEEAVPQFKKTLDLDPTFVDARETLTALGRAE